MNGKLKCGVKKTQKANLWEAQEFWDNDKIKTSGTFVESQWPEPILYPTGWLGPGLPGSSAALGMVCATLDFTLPLTVSRNSSKE